MEGKALRSFGKTKGSRQKKERFFIESSGSLVFASTLIRHQCQNNAVAVGAKTIKDKDKDKDKDVVGLVLGRLA